MEGETQVSMISWPSEHQMTHILMTDISQGNGVLLKIFAFITGPARKMTTLLTHTVTPNLQNCKKEGDIQ